MARSRSGRRAGTPYGPALPGLEDTVSYRPTPRDAAPPPPASAPAASLPARLALELCRARRPELLGVLALVALRSSGGLWRATQRQVADALGLPERTVRRHERELVALGVLEVLGRAGERRLRVIHGVVHKLPTPDTGDRSNRTPVAGPGEDKGTRAREDPGTGRYKPSSLHVRAGARARAPLSPPVRLRLEELAGSVGLWSNVLPELLELGRLLEVAWGSGYLGRYLGRLEQHVSTHDADRRAGLVLGSLRSRVRKLGRGPRRAS